MYCTYCNFYNGANNKFCESCGKSLNETLADTQPIKVRIAKNKDDDKSMSGIQTRGKTTSVISRFKIVFVILFALTVLVSVFTFFNDRGSSNPEKIANKLPGGAYTSLVTKLQEFEQNQNYNIVSVTRGDDWNGDELWCVKFDRSVKIGGLAEDKHIYMIHVGNLWKPMVGGTENAWLSNGCIGW